MTEYALPWFDRARRKRLRRVEAFRTAIASFFAAILSLQTRSGNTPATSGLHVAARLDTQPKQPEDSRTTFWPPVANVHHIGAHPATLNL